MPGQETVDIAEERTIKVDDDEHERYEIRQILDSRMNRRRRDPATGERGLLEYMVEWKWPEQVDVWQPYFNMKSRLMIDEYHRRHPEAPGPHSAFDEYDDNETAAAVLWVAGICPHTVAGGEWEETAPGSAVKFQAESYRDKAAHWGDVPANSSPNIVSEHEIPKLAVGLNRRVKELFRCRDFTSKCAVCKCVGF